MIKLEKTYESDILNFFLYFFNNKKWSLWPLTSFVFLHKKRRRIFPTENFPAILFSFPSYLETPPYRTPNSKNWKPILFSSSSLATCNSQTLIPLPLGFTIHPHTFLKSLISYHPFPFPISDAHKGDMLGRFQILRYTNGRSRFRPLLQRHHRIERFRQE